MAFSMASGGYHPRVYASLISRGCSASGCGIEPPTYILVGTASGPNGKFSDGKRFEDPIGRLVRGEVNPLQDEPFKELVTLSAQAMLQNLSALGCR